MLLIPTGLCTNAAVVIGGLDSTNHALKGGTYFIVAGLVSGNHAVYQQKDGGSNYLFYWIDSKDWLIGLDYKTSSAGVASIDNQESTCPDDATSWKYYDGDAWVSSAAITCKAIQAWTATTAVPETEDGCKDLPSTNFTSSATGERYSCAQLKGYCKHAQHGAEVMEQCPMTCGACGALRMWMSKRCCKR